MTRLLRDTMEDWAGEARVPPNLADRALRKRSWKPFGAAVLVMAMIGLVAVFVTVQREPASVVRPANGISLPPRPSPAPTDVRTDTENVPPATLIAAGRMAVSAYYVATMEKAENGYQRVRRTWSLYDPRTGGYEQTAYGWVDVAPGLQVAAVLEGDLPSRRLGVLDMNTRQILAWYDLDHPVASAAWSPDGTKIVATAYSDYPDLRERARGRVVPRMGDSPRTGYHLIDVTAGTVDYHELAPLPTIFSADRGSADQLMGNRRQDLDWGVDGERLWSPTNTQPDRVWYTLDGRRTDAPADQRYVGYSRIPATSPDGRLVLGPDGLPTQITEVATGKVAGRQQVLQLHAWADDDNVIALGCAGKCENEFRNGLVLVSVDGSRTTRLAATSDSDKDGAWRWILTPR
ncbi:MAG: hypothetical protein HOY71_25445 [Nonomuraea sp.]|nr:hypothetical protein [Nonomuraea sp.]